jgi:1-acyl-sn-glycerol-3-phosphate acyltransferase
MRIILLQIFLFQPVRFVFERIFGWRYDGKRPQEPKFIAVFAPHTSKWDFVLMLYITVMARRFPNWIGKQELFENPVLGKFYRWVGGIPVDRDNPLTALKQMIRSVKAMDTVTLVINPEGTRQYSDHWKKGFYYLAHKTNTPLVLVSLDYGRRVITLRKGFLVSGDIEKDMEMIRAFYADVRGAIPEHTSDMRILA